MNTKNEIIIKGLRPQYIMLSIAGTVGFVIMAFLFKPSQTVLLSDGLYESQKKAQIMDIVGATMSIFGSILIAYLCISGALQMRKKANEFATMVAKEYLKREIAKYPETYKKELEMLLSNPTALENIATFISNELYPAEQQQVLKAVNNLQNISTEEQFNAVCSEVISIIDKHMHGDGMRPFDTEFEKKVRTAIECEIVKQKQEQNARTGKEYKTLCK